MVYNSNEGLKEYINTIIDSKGLKKRFIASKMNVIPQQLNNILNKEHITLDDVQRICQAMDCQLEINIVPLDRK